MADIILGLFGLDRSLRWNWRSIRNGFVRPLARHHRVRVFAHFNKPRFIHNPRNGEIHLRHVGGGIEHLKPEQCQVEPQAARLPPAQEDFIHRYAYRDLPDEGGRSRRNLIYQLTSLQRLNALFARSDLATDSLFLLVRPDLLYLDRLDYARDVRPVLDRQCDIMLPDWGRWGGENDRFCIANAAAMACYTRRLADLEPYSRARGYIHSEELLAHVLQRDGLRIGPLPLRACRVRANGVVKVETCFPVSARERHQLNLRSILNRFL